MRALVELLLAVPLERPAANATDDPHGDVSGQMQQQVADAVRSVVGPPPDVVIVQNRHRPLNFRQEVLQQQLSRFFQERAAGVAHTHSANFGITATSDGAMQAASSSVSRSMGQMSGTRMTAMPAAAPARTPCRESSSTTHSPAERPRQAAARR